MTNPPAEDSTIVTVRRASTVSRDEIAETDYRFAVLKPYLKVQS
jgi:hypothetical protein